MCRLCIQVRGIQHIEVHNAIRTPIYDNIFELRTFETEGFLKKKKYEHFEQLKLLKILNSAILNNLLQ